MAKETRLYNLLGISTEANEQEIRKAYKFLALKYHPDKNNTISPEEKERFTNIFNSLNEAYNILSDKNKRYLYDNYGEEVAKNPRDQSTFSVDNQYYYPPQHHSQHQQQFHHFHHQNFSDAMASHFSNSFTNFFNNFPPNNFMNYNNDNSFSNFSVNAFDNYNNRNANSFKYHQDVQNLKMKKGKDIMDNISCTLLDYYNGKDIKLSLSRRIKCPKCRSRGGLKVYTCNDCCGSGCIINETISGMTYQRTQSTCNRCLGTGEFIPTKYICDECDGNKLVDTKVIFDFKVPRGATDGYKIVLPKAADEGINLIPGDVILTLRDSKEDTNLRFKRIGNNLLTTIKIPLVKVLCGGYINFKHISDETIKICIPRGDIQSYNQLKILKGFGMPINAHATTTSSDHKRRKQGDPKSKHKSKSNSKSTSKSRTNLNVDNIVDSTDNENSNVNNNEAKNSTVGNEKNNENELNVTLNASDSNREDDENNPKFGDLIIKFDIEFPDLKSFTNEQVATLSKVLGSSDCQTVDTGLDVTSKSSINPNSVSAIPVSIDESSSSNVSKTQSSAENITNKDATDGLVSRDEELKSDATAEKIVYLQDLTNIDKLEVSMSDFPEVFNEGDDNEDNYNGSTGVIGESSTKTAKRIDNSYSGSKRNSKRAKVESEDPSETEVN